jgi:hypothetical protein
MVHITPQAEGNFHRPAFPRGLAGLSTMTVYCMAFYTSLLFKNAPSLKGSSGRRIHSSAASTTGIAIAKINVAKLMHRFEIS